MRRTATFKPLVGVILALGLIVVAGAAFAQQRGPGAGGGPGGGRMQGMADLRYVETAWMAACFELNVSAQQLASLRPTFQAAYKLRQDAMEKARTSRDVSGLEATGKRIKSSIDAKLKQVLTAQQMTKWQKLQKEAEARRQAGRGAAGGGGQR